MSSQSESEKFDGLEVREAGQAQEQELEQEEAQEQEQEESPEVGQEEGQDQEQKAENKKEEERKAASKAQSAAAKESTPKAAAPKTDEGGKSSSKGEKMAKAAKKDDAASDGRLEGTTNLEDLKAFGDALGNFASGGPGALLTGAKKLAKKAFSGSDKAAPARVAANTATGNTPDGGDMLMLKEKDGTPTVDPVDNAKKSFDAVKTPAPQVGIDSKASPDQGAEKKAESKSRSDRKPSKSKK